MHYGYRRVHVLLQREGWQDNHKRIYRLYREQGLSLRLKRPRRNKAAKNRQPVQAAAYPNQIWAMDFVSDALFDGRRLRMLTIIDLFTRKCLGIVTGQSLKGDDMKETLTRIARFRGALASPRYSRHLRAAQSGYPDYLVSVRDRKAVDKVNPQQISWLMVRSVRSPARE